MSREGQEAVLKGIEENEGRKGRCMTESDIIEKDERMERNR